MKYDTTPLSIDTAGVDLTAREKEIRFVPADSPPNEYRHIESGEISHPTLVGRSVGFETFIESRPDTSRLEGIKEKLSAPKYRTWALTALLASASAFGGGFAVYWIGSQRSAVTTSETRTAVIEPETDINAAHTFVSKAAADSAAGQSIDQRPLVAPAAKVPHPNGPATEIAAVTPASDDTNRVTQDPPSNTMAANATGNESQQLEREAKVGAYVVEKPNGRKPLARCADGTYSYSASKAAACAGRGGVGEWIGEGKIAPTTPAKQAAYVLGPRGGCYYLDGSSKKIYVEKKYCEQ